MAAVAAEPGASAVPTTTAGNDLELEPRPAHSGIESQSDTILEYAPVMDLVPQFNNRDAAEECGRVQIELANSSRPEVEAAGKALAARSAEEHIKESGCLSLGGKENITEDISVETYGSEYNTLSTGQSIRERFPSMVESANEVCNIAVKQHEPYAFHQNSSIITDSQPSVVFLHSFPTHPPPSEAGLSLAEPAEPTTTDYYQNPQITRPTEICDYRALIKPTVGGELEPEPIYDDPPSAEYKNAGTSDDAVLERSVIIKDQVVGPLMVSDIEAPLGTAFEMDCSCDFASVKAQNSIDELRVNDAVVMVPRSTAAERQQSPCYSQKRRSETDLQHIKNDTTESTDSNPPLPYPFDPTEVPLVSVEQLTPGSEVRVSLDHIIDDALVVSFRLGDKVFSGVLMDLSKRFGPYGIPITVFPKREYKDKPQSMQLHRQPDPGSDSNEEPKRMPAAEDKVLTDPTATDTAQGAVVEVADPTPASQPQPACPPHPWTSKPPPLFQEGAPYPPPLFIRDTYNQSLPQPLPRKIKRPKRRLYREEPTSIMNAIKLRPRQVLCDKCKGVVVSSGPRESTSRRGPASDLRNEDAKRRRQTDSSSAASSKRPRNDTKEEKGRASETSKRQITSGLRVSSSSPSSSSLARGGGAGSRVLRGVASTSSSLTSSNSTANSNNSRVHLNSSKKILGSKTSGVDQSKAREVLKLARTAQAAHRRQQREAASSTTTTHPNPAGANVPKTMTRAAALQVANQNQKVHFTRRLQQLSGVGPHAPLPPRMRIKPQRYRNEEGQVPSSSSPPKQPPCLSADKGLAGSRLTPPKPASCSALDSDPNPATFPPPTPAAPPASALGRAFASFPNAAPTLAPATGVPPCPSTPSTSSSSSSSSASTGEAIFAFDSQVISSVPRLQPQPESCSGTELEDDEQQEKREEKKESAADTPVASSNLVVFMTLDPSRQADSSSLCSLDTDDLKSSISECSSTETVDFPLQGNLHSSSSSNPPPPTPSLAPPGSSSSSPPPLNVLPQTSKEEVGDGNKRRKSSKASTFSKNVTKCVSAEGRTICVGDIVWAKIHGFPWWPARVVGITVSRRDTGLLVQQEARVSWFGSPTTSFLPTTQLAPFLESFQSRFDKKRKGLYRKAITEAARAAKQLTPEVRALLTQFET